VGSIRVLGFSFVFSPVYAIVNFFHHYYLFLFGLSIRFCPIEKFSAATGNSFENWLLPFAHKVLSERQRGIKRPFREKIG
jgi:hypothetical protein